MTNEKKSYKYKILFVEDDHSIRENYVNYLKRYFENVYEVSDGINALKYYDQYNPNILIIDIDIPKINGIDLLKKIRINDHSTRAIMLTAHSEIELLLQAAELKLTKYLVKPVSRNDLKEALNLAIEEIESYSTTNNLFVKLSNDYKWDNKSNTLLYQNNPIHLTKTESTIMSLLIAQKNNVVTYETLIYHLWDETYEDRSNALKTAINKLRKKIPKDLLDNDYGFGYRINTFLD